MSSRRCRGIALAWTAIMLLVMVGFLGLAVDWGKLVTNAHELHNGADAAALAGALVVKINQTQARDDAIRIASRNLAESLSISVDRNSGNDPNGELVVGRWLNQWRTFTPTQVSPNAVKVAARRLGQRDTAPPLSLLFGPVFGTNTANAGRYAIARCTGSIGAGIITLAEDPTTLPGYTKTEGMIFAGTVDIDLRGVDFYTGEEIVGDIQVNADGDPARTNKYAFNINGQSATVYAGDFNINGDSNPHEDNPEAWEALIPDDGNPFSIDENTGYVMPDPLGDMNPPPNIYGMDVPLDGHVKLDASGNPVLDAEGNPIPTRYTYEIDSTIIRQPENLVTAADGTTHYEIHLPPGYYPGGIYPGNNDVVILDGFTGGSDPVASGAGVFAFGGGTSAGGSGAGLRTNGGSIISNGGVLIYLTGDAAGATPHPQVGAKVQYAEVDLQGGGTISLDPRGDFVSPVNIEGEYGVTIWQDRNNLNTATLNGMGTFDIAGTLYFPSNAVSAEGDIEKGGSQLICGALQISGGLSLGIAYDGRNRDSSIRSCLVD